MPGFRLYSELSLSVRITDFIPYGTKVIHDRLAVSEDGFKNLFLVLMRRQVQILRRERPKFLEDRHHWREASRPHPVCVCKHSPATFVAAVIAPSGSLTRRSRAFCQAS
jgi:hypothetical protein